MNSSPLAPPPSKTIGRLSPRWGEGALPMPGHRPAIRDALHKNCAFGPSLLHNWACRAPTCACHMGVTAEHCTWHALCMTLVGAKGWPPGECMKLVIAVIKPFKLDEVREALSAAGVQGMTVTEVKGFGRQKGQTEIYRGAEYTTNMVPKIKIEVAIEDAQAALVVETIQQAAHTGSIGDGKIFVTEIGQAVRIRTGETNETAL
jgi:nitrogen regulatory protein P-II 2